MGAGASATDVPARPYTASALGTRTNVPQVMAVHPTRQAPGNIHDPDPIQKRPMTSPTHAVYPRQQFQQVTKPENNPFQAGAIIAASEQDQCQPGSHTLPSNDEMANRSRVFQPSPPLPPIGFHQEVLSGPIPSSGMRPMSGRRPASGRPQSGRPGSVAQWDDAKDLVFMRVLSAEEYLGRMWETDEQITSWSSCEVENQVKYGKIKELLGLRGHLQDELLRIEAMLAAGDPQLQSLRDFEAEFSHVVNRLRELNKKSQCIQIQSIDIGIDPSELTSSSSPSSSIGTQMTPRSQGHTSTQSQGQSVGGHNSGVQNSGQDTGVGDDGEIDEGLRRKFIAEEDHVTGDFARQFAQTGRRLGQEDIDRLLNEHAISMQALRKKQNMEKDKYKELLDAKKRERLLNRRPGEPETNPATRPTASSRNKSGDFFFVDFSNSKSNGSGGKGRKPTLPKKDSWGPQSGWFYVDMDGNSSSDQPKISTSGDIEPVQRQGTFTKDSTDPIERQRTFVSESGKPFGIATRIPSAKTDNVTEDDPKTRVSDSNSESEGDYEDDFEDDGSEEEDEELKTTLKDDLWTTLQEDGTSKAKFQDLLNAYKNQEEGRKALKDAEGLKHKSSFLAKLAERQKKKGSGGNEMETQTDGVSTSSMSTGTNDPFEKELNAIKEKDNELVKKLLAKRKTMSEADFKELLKKHLSDVERLRRQRVYDQERLREKLKEKLKRRRANKGSDESDSSEGEDEASESLDLEEGAANDAKLQRELTELDEKLERELRKRGKNVDESDLTELLEHYRRQQEALLNRRRVERKQIDDKLKKRLEEKKHRGASAEEPTAEGDESIFHELQRMQMSGELTEEMFSAKMKEYLDQVDRDKQADRLKKKEQRKKKHEIDRDAASTLVQKHQEQTQQIKGIRQREKDIMDQKLKKKLMAKKNKGPKADN